MTVRKRHGYYFDGGSVVDLKPDKEVTETIEGIYELWKAEWGDEIIQLSHIYQPRPFVFTHPAHGSVVISIGVPIEIVFFLYQFMYSSCCCSDLAPRGLSLWSCMFPCPLLCPKVSQYLHREIFSLTRSITCRPSFDSHLRGVSTKDVSCTHMSQLDDRVTGTVFGYRRSNIPKRMQIL